eukprot:TRINITY_DN43226_c0_g1_i1.p1 TRINITY_DN43226_c0_g1~~TRINITY_DN43226_c0_g1_i1.p1  ORF type:complete len:1015 (+),score=172.96 TRINITY_DN43226_c0_g1_i1:73-3117(+)
MAEAAPPAGSAAEPLRLFARVPGGGRRLAAAEVAAVVRPQAPPQEHTNGGRVTFQIPFSECADEAGAAAAAARICRLRTVEHVYCTLAEGSLQRGKVRKAAQQAAGAAGAHADPTALGGDAALEAMRAAAAAIPRQRFAAALRLRRAAARERADGAPPPEDDAAVRVHVVAKRGGKHTFSSDDAKRAVAQGMGRAGIALGCKEHDATAFLHVHQGAWWVGLQLNHSTLLDAVFLSKSRAQLVRELEKQAAGGEGGGSDSADGATAGEAAEGAGCADPEDAGECEWLAALCERAGAAARDQRGRQHAAAAAPAAQVQYADDVVAPLRSVPYADRLRQKEEELRHLLVRVARRLRRLYKPEHGALPSWLEAREGAGLYCDFAPIAPHPAPDAAWLSSAVVTVAPREDGASGAVVGPRAPSSTCARRGARQEQGGAVFPAADCAALPEGARAAAAALSSAIDPHDWRSVSLRQGSAEAQGAAPPVGVLLQRSRAAVLLRRPADAGGTLKVCAAWLAEQRTRTAAGEAAAARCPLSGLTMAEFERQRDEHCLAQPQPYRAGQRILVIGDGDFSWSRALAERFRREGGPATAAGIVASTNESLEEVMAAYPATAEHLRGLAAAGGLALFGVDCTHPGAAAAVLRQLPAGCETLLFDVVVFNFPHTADDNTGSGSRGMREVVAANRALLAAYFRCARALLRDGGEAHCTLMRRHPYTEWAVDAQARQAGLTQLRPFEFEYCAWPGYHHVHTNRAAAAKITEALTHRYRSGGGAGSCSKGAAPLATVSRYAQCGDVAGAAPGGTACWEPPPADDGAALAAVTEALRGAGVASAAVAGVGSAPVPLYGCEDGEQWMPPQRLCGCAFRSPEPFRPSLGASDDLLRYIVRSCLRRCGEASPPFPTAVAGPPTEQPAASDATPDVVLDLCCGSGTIAIACAAAASARGRSGLRCVGVDRASVAAAAAERNAAENGVAGQCEWLVGDAAEEVPFADGAALSSAKRLVCVVDAPAAGSCSYLATRWA